MADFDACQLFTLKMEGGLSDDAQDKGGLTKYGVSWAYLKDLERSRPSLVRDILGVSVVSRNDIYNLTKEQAGAFFKATFWTPYDLDTMPQSVALCWYDMNVNHGAGNTAKILQRACNACDFTVPKLVVDGKPGPKTKTALRHMGNKEGINAIANERGAFYNRIVASNPSQKVFIKGWKNRCEAMRKQALAWVEDD
jgi:lysozyme family protein